MITIKVEQNCAGSILYLMWLLLAGSLHYNVNCEMAFYDPDLRWLVWTHMTGTFVSSQVGYCSYLYVV